MEFNNNFDKSQLLNFDPIDLLIKVRYSELFLRTDEVNFSGNREYTYHNVSCFQSYLIPFVMSHSFSKENIKITACKLLEICADYSNSTLSEIDLDDINYKIKYSQNQFTEILSSFVEVPFYALLPSQDSILLEKYGISSKELNEDIFQNILPRFNKINGSHPKNFIEFIDNIYSYISIDDFEIGKTHCSYSIFKDLSCKIGEYKCSDFDESNPISLIDIKRKICIFEDEKVYCFSPQLIVGKMIKCIERTCSNGTQNQLWRNNYKIATESIVEAIFPAFLKSGIYYSNVYYRLGKKRLETDGIFIYKSYIFVIEIKGERVNPDSIITNKEKVRDSYKDLIHKAKEQCSNVLTFINSSKSIDFVKDDNSPYFKIQNPSEYTIIPISIFFEEIGTVISGYNIGENTNLPILINFYDLLTVFDFLQHPLLICKYLKERYLCIPISEVCINDEFQYLGLFRDCLNLNAYIVSQVQSVSKDKKQKISGFIFDGSFAQPIGLYYENPNSIKPNIKTSKLIDILLSGYDEKVDKRLFNILMILMEYSIADQNKVYAKFIDKNNSFSRIPQPLRMPQNNGEDYVIFFKSKTHNLEEEKIILAFLLSYFKRFDRVKKIFIANIFHKTCYFETISPKDKRLTDLTIVEKSKHIVFKETKTKFID
jgi:hypothetical protein